MCKTVWHPLHFPAWPTSPIWHPCRRKQSTRSNCWRDVASVTLRMFSLRPSHTHIYLHDVDNVCTMHRSFIYVLVINHVVTVMYTCRYAETIHHLHRVFQTHTSDTHTHSPHTTWLWLLQFRKTPLAEWQKHSTELVIYCLYNWYVWIKNNEMSFIYYSNFVSNYYLT